MSLPTPHHSDLSIAPEPLFSSADRDILGDERIELTSVGVDIGSATTHLAFSRLVLERVGQRYAVTSRSIVHQSNILLTPYSDPDTIDGDRLEEFVNQQYAAAGFSRNDIDTGALICTGTALLKHNSRTIAELFAGETGRFVAVSAGDRLEASLAAYGSGAVAASSARGGSILNIDIGGGTTKFGLCRNGVVVSTAAIDAGARLIAVDAAGKVARVEDAARKVAAELGLDLELGLAVDERDLRRIARYLAERILEVVRGGALSEAARGLLRTPELDHPGAISGLLFSGGVSEFIYGREALSFGDLGSALAQETLAAVNGLGIEILEPVAGIRATVIGASQHTLQLTGNTIFVKPASVIPIRNVPVARLDMPWDHEPLTPEAVAPAVTRAIERIDLEDSQQVALAIQWEGSASFSRLSALAHGITTALAGRLAAGQPLILICDSDVGGLLGIFFHEEMHLANGILSIDGVDAREFDFVDVGELIASSGAAPVVIKSLVFPESV